MVNLGTDIDLIARLRAVSEEDAAAVLDTPALSDPLTAQDVLALYHGLLDVIVGEEA